MKVLQFIVNHANLEDLMAKRCLARLLSLEDLGHERDQYIVNALVRDEHLDIIIAKSVGRPRWVTWP